MSRRSLENECRRENRQNRGVDVVRNQSRDDFWRRSSGNFFISGDENTYAGDMGWERRQMLISAIKNAPDFAPRTVFVLHNDDILEQELISQAGTLNRQLVVISGKYRNYHMFYGMNPEQIMTCINEVGNLYRYHNMQDTDAYARAFMEILEGVYPISLQSMMALAENSDKKICEIAEFHGVDPDTRERFNWAANTAGTNTFREILRRISSATEEITTKSCNTGFNMLTASRGGEASRVVLINMNSRSPEVLNRCIRYELEEIRGRRVAVIVDDIPMSREDGIIDAIKNIGRNPYGAAGMCAGDIFNMISEEDLRGFHTHCVFRHANNRSLETFLSHYGTYRYAYVQETNTTSEGRLFVLIPQKSYIKVYEENHPRIMQQEMSLAVLKGHQAERPMIVDRLS